jgi:pimeloyl-ACP methyl ester carboxylesterase
VSNTIGDPAPSPRCLSARAGQLETFADEVVGGKVTLVANSVGGLAALCFARAAPGKVHAVQLYNISLRMLHRDNQSPLQRPLVAALQSVLRKSGIGEACFARLATRRAVKSVLSQAYHDTAAVTDELVECVLRPGLEPGAVQVFLDFIRRAPDSAAGLCACVRVCALGTPQRIACGASNSARCVAAVRSTGCSTRAATRAARCRAL